MLDVERRPGTSFLIFRVGDAVIGVVVPLGAHVGFARHGSALQILRQQSESPAGGGIGVVLRSHRANSPVHAVLMPDLSITNYNGGAGSGEARSGRDF